MANTPCCEGPKDLLGVGVILLALYPKVCLCGIPPLTGLAKKDAKLIWDDDCEQVFLELKKSLVQPPVLAYPMRDGPFVLCTDVSDTGMGALLDQEQEEDGKVVKKVIVVL